MDVTALKANFEEQISSVDKQIQELEGNLEKAKEYKLKLLGGMETIALLEQGEAPPVPEVEETADIIE
jgi:hypothetical protein